MVRTMQVNQFVHRTAMDLIAIRIMLEELMVFRIALAQTVVRTMLVKQLVHKAARDLIAIRIMLEELMVFRIVLEHTVVRTMLVDRRQDNKL